MMDANKAMFSALPATENADIAELQARLIRRTEEATATAYRDAEIIRRLRDALQTYLMAQGWEACSHARIKAKTALAFAG
jgi:DNA-binding transcriptional MocR family regulator